MTVLRSRKIIPTIKSQPKTLKQGFIIEPTTPAKALEPPNKTSYNTSPSPSPLAQSLDPLGLGSNSGLVSGPIRRRSLRLASKLGSDSFTENVPISNRKRSFAAENPKNYSNVSDLKNVEMDDLFNIDLGVKKVRVSDRIRSKIRVSEELGILTDGEEGGVEEMKMGLDESVSRVNEGSLVRGLGEFESLSDLGNLGQEREKVVSAKKAKGKRDFDIDVVFSALELAGEGERDNNGPNLGSRTVPKGRMEGNGIGLNCRSFIRGESGDGEKSVHENGMGGKERENERVSNSVSGEGVLMNESESDPRVNQNSNPKGRSRFSREEKGKSVDKAFISNGAIQVELELGTKFETLIGNAVSDAAHIPGTSDSKDGQSADENGTGDKGRSRLSRDEKGKGKIVEDDLLTNRIDAVGISIESKVSGATHLGDDVALQDGRRDMEANARANTLRARAYKERANTSTTRDYKERFRDIAKKNASRFAHFPSQEEEENHAVDEREEPPSEVDREMEDWPGPFSTAMKIIKDRERKANVQQQNSSLDKSNSAPVIWVPRKDQQHGSSKLLIPSLQELCMAILAKNADAITSLDTVPDVLRHKLSQLLCDSRRMNDHFFELLVRGSPTEIRVRDCSWLTEEQFTSAFEGCDFNNLTVLQLDQCGRCMPDYILFTTLARSSSSLPALTAISVKGACRLSDVGLSALVSSAPALRSVNLSQCSLLTSEGIICLSDKLGSVLRELYIDDCQSLDAMLILPALSKLEHLEVLSLAGIETVCDDFVSQFVAVCGHNLKELVLTDCVKLTDSSLKVISETCAGLRAIDLTNLCKLTDYAIGYLANGCQAIQTLKLCRNTFSDEAIAAYLETRGESLKELSLNNVNKVAHNTAISLARRSRNLLSLDLSWCRNLTNEALGLIVDSCLSLKVLKLFGCTQITNVFLDGHSNSQVQVIGLRMSPILEHLKVPDLLGPLHYSSISSTL